MDVRHLEQHGRGVLALFQNLFVVFEGLGVTFGDKERVGGFETKAGGLSGGEMKGTDSQKDEYPEKF
jgi:hypothetical protein